MKGTIKYSQEFPSPMGNKWIGIDYNVNENDDWDEKFRVAEAMVFGWGNKNNSLTLTAGGPPYQVIPSVTPVLDRNKDRVEIAIDNATTIEQLDLLMGDVARYGLNKEFNAKKKELLQSNKT